MMTSRQTYKMTMVKIGRSTKQMELMKKTPTGPTVFRDRRNLEQILWIYRDIQPNKNQKITIRKTKSQ
jgi:hypothetical protein